MRKICRLLLDWLLIDFSYGLHMTARGVFQQWRRKVIVFEKFEGIWEKLEMAMVLVNGPQDNTNWSSISLKNMAIVIFGDFC